MRPVLILPYRYALFYLFHTFSQRSLRHKSSASGDRSPQRLNTHRDRNSRRPTDSHLELKQYGHHDRVLGHKRMIYVFELMHERINAWTMFLNLNRLLSLFRGTVHFFFSNVMVLIYECRTKHRPLYWHLVPLYGFPHTQAPFSIGNPLHSSDAEAPVNHKDTIINIFIIKCCFYSIAVQLIKRYVISIYRKFYLLDFIH